MKYTQELPYLSTNNYLTSQAPKKIQESASSVDFQMENKLFELQLKSMSSVIQSITSDEESIIIRIPKSGEGYKSWSVALPLVQLSPTICHILAASGTYMERSKYITFSFGSQTMVLIIDYLQRKYLRLLKRDLSPYDEFHIPLDCTIPVLNAAHYLEFDDLLELCISLVASNFDSIQTLQGIPDDCASKILEKLNIGDMVLALNGLQLSNTAVSHLWLDKFSKIIQSSTYDRNLIQIAREKCLEFYVGCALTRSHLVENHRIFRVLELQGHLIRRVQFNIPKATDHNSLNLWMDIFRHLNLQELVIECDTTRPALGPILAGANSKKCNITVIVPLYLSDGVFKALSTLIQYPAPQQSKPTILAKHTNDIKLNMNRNKKAPLNIVRNECILTLKARPGQGDLNDFLVLYNHVESPIIPIITSLDLSNQDLGPSGASSLAKCFQNCNRFAIERLNLENTNLGAQGLIAILESLVHFKDSIRDIARNSPSNVIREINLSKTLNVMEPKIVDCLKILGNISQLFPKLQSFEFAYNSTNSIGINAFLHGISSSSIENINISGLAISACIDYIRCLLRNQSLRKLSIKACRLVPRQVYQLFLEKSSVVVLDLSENTIDYNCIVQMGKWLIHTPIEKLHLTLQNQNDELVEKLISAASHAKNLQELHLRDCNLVDSFCAILTKYPICIRYLDLSNNSISEIGLSILIASNLETCVDLRGNCISKSSIAAAQAHRTLHVKTPFIF